MRYVCTPTTLATGLLLCPHSPLEFRSRACLLTTMAVMGPEECFSLVCRAVAEVTAVDSADGSNLPFLLLFRVVMRFRNLAFLHTPVDTLALSNYLTTTYLPAKFEDVAQGIADAFKVPMDQLDVAPRITVRLRCS